MAALLAALALFTPSSPACHPNLTWSIRAQLDADPAAEIAYATDAHDCGHTGFHTLVQVRDRCEGSWRTYTLLDVDSRLLAFRVIDVDGWTHRKEVFVATAAGGIVVRLEHEGGSCPVPVQLFAYEPSPTPEGFLPGPAASVALGDFDPNSRGLEVKVTETFMPIAPGSPLERVTVFLYDRRERKYVATPTIRSPHERQAPQTTTVTTTPRVITFTEMSR